MNARFITLDGIDGAGKSTHLAAMRQWFAQHNLPVLFTREPGGLMQGGDPDDLANGDTITITSSALVLEQLIGKFMTNFAEGNAHSKAASDASETPSTP